MTARTETAAAALAALLLAGCVSLAPRSQPASASAALIPDVPARRWAQNRCAAGALSEVLQGLGSRVTEEELTAELTPARSGGVVTVDLLLAARRHGFDAQLVRGTDEMVRDELTAGRPLILMLRVLDARGEGDDLYHYVVLSGFDPGHQLVALQYGDGLKRWVSLDSIRASWAAAGYAVFLIGPRQRQKATEDDLQRAVLLEEAGQTEQAITLYRHYLNSHPQSALGWTNLGNAHAGLGQNDLAEVAYRNALFVEKDYRDALNNLALLLFGLGRLEEAESLARRAADQDLPDRDRAVDTLERILEAKPPPSARKTYTWLTVATIFDIESTFLQMRRCDDCREANPIARYFVDRGRAATYAYSLAVNAAVMYIAQRLRERGDPWWYLAPIALAAVHVVAGTWNLTHRD